MIVCPGEAQNARVVRLDGEVVRFANRSVPLCRTVATVRRARQLADAGVLVCEPSARGSLRLSADGHASVWVDAGDPGRDAGRGTDWHAVGIALRGLHARGLRALADETLPVIDDLTYHRQRVLDLHDRGALSDVERRVLEFRVSQLDARVRTHHLRAVGPIGSTPRVVVHDDVWAKNVVRDPRTGVTRLVDLDNLALARPVYDLAFIARHLHSGYLTPRQATEFETGYGALLPAFAEAKLWGDVHQMRWLLNIIERVHNDLDVADMKPKVWRSVLGEDLPLASTALPGRSGTEGTPEAVVGPAA